MALVMGAIAAAFYLRRHELVSNIFGGFLIDFVANVLPAMLAQFGRSPTHAMSSRATHAERSEAGESRDLQLPFARLTHHKLRVS